KKRASDLEACPRYRRGGGKGQGSIFGDDEDLGRRGEALVNITSHELRQYRDQAQLKKLGGENRAGVHGGGLFNVDLPDSETHLFPEPSATRFGITVCPNGVQVSNNLLYLPASYQEGKVFCHRIQRSSKMSRRQNFVNVSRIAPHQGKPT